LRNSAYHDDGMCLEQRVSSQARMIGQTLAARNGHPTLSIRNGEVSIPRARQIPSPSHYWFSQYSAGIRGCKCMANDAHWASCMAATSFPTSVPVSSLSSLAMSVGLCLQPPQPLSRGAAGHNLPPYLCWFSREDDIFMSLCWRRLTSKISGRENERI
jgi:hypothetical protein